MGAGGTGIALVLGQNTGAQAAGGEVGLSCTYTRQSSSQYLLEYFLLGLCVTHEDPGLPWTMRNNSKGELGFRM